VACYALMGMREAFPAHAGMNRAMNRSAPRNSAVADCGIRRALSGWVMSPRFVRRCLINRLLRPHGSRGGPRRIHQAAPDESHNRLSFNPMQRPRHFSRTHFIVLSRIQGPVKRALYQIGSIEAAGTNGSSNAIPRLSSTRVPAWPSRSIASSMPHKPRNVS